MLLLYIRYIRYSRWKCWILNEPLKSETAKETQRSSTILPSQTLTSFWFLLSVCSCCVVVERWYLRRIHSFIAEQNSSQWYMFQRGTKNWTTKLKILYWISMFNIVEDFYWYKPNTYSQPYMLVKTRRLWTHILIV